MHAIDLMVSEHRLIEQVLDSLAALARRAVAGEPIEPEHLGDIVTFLRGYADAIHHGKEEAILFAELYRQGCPPEFAPVVDSICRDHEIGRNLVDDLAAALKRPTPWTDVVRDRVALAAADFVSLLRRHIEREDQLVFPEAEKHLDAQSIERVEAACARFEAEHAAKRAELERIAAAVIG